MESLILSPTHHPRQFRTPSGQIVCPPEDWECLPPGDPGFTRRVKALGPTWSVVETRGRKTFSRGIWASSANIELARRQIAEQRADPAYSRRLAAAAQRRESAQSEYVESFRAEVLAFLNFAPTHADLAAKLADAVTAHATPVGSGTVARTNRIDIDRRAEAAVVAWLRHQTTGYDSMRVASVKGERRRVRQRLAEGSRKLLEDHRLDAPHDAQSCVLCQTLLEKRGHDILESA